LIAIKGSFGGIGDSGTREASETAAMADAQITEQQVVATYKSMRAEVRQLAEKIGELEVEITEHDRVVQTLQGLPDDRKAYRMVGGVLVERTVKEVLPAVSSNREGIAQVLAQLNESIKQKEAAANDWQVCGRHYHQEYVWDAGTRRLTFV
jgi:prefoldin subunit 2